MNQRISAADAVPIAAVAVLFAVATAAFGSVPAWWALIVAVAGAAAGGAVLVLVEPVLERSAVVAPTAPPQPLAPPATVEPSEPPILVERPEQPAPPVTVERPLVERVGGWTLVTTAKVGNDQDQNEDSVATSGDGRLVAVADGASSAFASGVWAQLMTGRFVAGVDDLSTREGRVTFRSSCADEWQHATESSGEWWATEARSRGSAAAFVGVDVGPDGEWSAFAVGDCCVFQLDEAGHIVNSFPVASADEFGLTPDLLSVNQETEGWTSVQGRLLLGHRLLLASDGLAEWLLADPTRVHGLLAASPDSWIDTFDAERAADNMTNDDVAAALMAQGYS